jgi:hypothetical protein
MLFLSLPKNGNLPVFIPNSEQIKSISEATKDKAQRSFLDFIKIFEKSLFFVLKILSKNI